MPEARPPVDVLVVGGGPAGAAAAITAARAGMRVTLADKASFPRDKCCGDGLTTGALRRLERLGLDPSAVPSWQPVTDVHVRSPSGRTVAYPLRDPGRPGVWAAVARRVDLDAALLDVARRAGATVLDGHGVVAARVTADAVTATVDGTGEVTAAHVIAADGMWSPTRKLLGPPSDGPYLGEWHAYRQYFSGVDTAAGRDLWVWFEPDLLPGYVWSFPLPGGRVNLGFGIERDPGTPTKMMKELWADLLRRPHIGDLLGEAAVPEQAPKAWPIPAAIGDAPLVQGRVLYAGDAARACDVLTGEGIGQALATGTWAAEAIAAGRDAAGGGAGAAGGGVAGIGLRYRAEVTAHLRPDHRMSSWLQVALRHDKVCRGAIRVSGSSAWARRNFGRWLFEDYPRGVALTPRDWRLTRHRAPGAYSDS